MKTSIAEQKRERKKAVDVLKQKTMNPDSSMWPAPAAIIRYADRRWSERSEVRLPTAELGGPPRETKEDELQMVGTWRPVRARAEAGPLVPYE